MATVLLRRVKSLIWQFHNSQLEPLPVVVVLPDKRPPPKDLENQAAVVYRTRACTHTVNKSEFDIPASKLSNRTHKSSSYTTDYRQHNDVAVQQSYASSSSFPDLSSPTKQRPARRRSHQQLQPCTAYRSSERNIHSTSDLKNCHKDSPSVHLLRAYYTPEATFSPYPATALRSNLDHRESIAEARNLDFEERYEPDRAEVTHQRLMMASEGVTPPVPYERMKDIATEACDSALSSVNKYAHAATETWNTTIINTILAALVSETASGSGSNSQQPPFKYVVNSTIIQHAPLSLKDEEGANGGTKATGRRGMHSASGAYWNNMKDGMWSFKYEAAEGKGLDVVVGIIWIWVG